MPTSGTTNYAATRDSIITRALRIVNAIGQGETPSPTAVTEAAQAFNELVKEYQTFGMALWKVGNYSITMTAGTYKYNIGTGQVAPHVDAPAPLKVLQAWTRTNTSNRIASWQANETSRSTSSVNRNNARLSLRGITSHYTQTRRASD